MGSMVSAVFGNPVLVRFREAVSTLYGDRLDRIVLFGSRARGDCKPDSDYDVAVFVRDLDEYADKAGREAYLAGYQAVLAFILDRSGKTPRTHRGNRSEFSRLARAEPGFARERLAFLGWTYELKTTAEYGAEQPVSIADAKRAISEAAALIECVAVLLPTRSGL